MLYDNRHLFICQLIVSRELQALLESKDPFGSLTYDTHTDATVYPPPEISFEDQKENGTSKKRKRNDDTAEKPSPAERVTIADAPCRYPQRVLTNSHLGKVFELVRGQCEEFISNCVCVVLCSSYPVLSQCLG